MVDFIHYLVDGIFLRALTKTYLGKDFIIYDIRFFLLHVSITHRDVVTHLLAYLFKYMDCIITHDYASKSFFEVIFKIKVDYSLDLSKNSPYFIREEIS